MKDVLSIIGCLVVLFIIITVGPFIIFTLIYLIPFLLTVGVILLVIYLIFCGIKSLIDNK